MLQYNSILILSYFFLSLVVLLLNYITKGSTNKLFFSSYRSSLFNPLTYVRFITHSIGHDGWQHFTSNFIYILLIGPMIEEKYGTILVLKMMIVTSLIIGIFNFIFSKKAILGSSGIVYMLIVISSAVNIENGKIPLTLILIFLFFIVNEIFKSIFKKDNISHFSHLIGALCGVTFIILMNYKII